MTSLISRRDSRATTILYSVSQNPYLKSQPWQKNLGLVQIVTTRTPNCSHASSISSVRIIPIYRGIRNDTHSHRLRFCVMVRKRPCLLTFWIFLNISDGSLTISSRIFLLKWVHLDPLMEPSDLSSKVDSSRSRLRIYLRDILSNMSAARHARVRIRHWSRRTGCSLWAVRAVEARGVYRQLRLVSWRRLGEDQRLRRVNVPVWQ